MVITDLEGRVVEGIAAAIVGSGDAPGAISRVSVDRRRGAYSFPPCHGVGAGGPRDSVLRHHARRLLPRCDSGDSGAVAGEIESDTKPTPAWRLFG